MVNDELAESKPSAGSAKTKKNLSAIKLSPLREADFQPINSVVLDTLQDSWFIDVYSPKNGNIIGFDPISGHNLCPSSCSKLAWNVLSHLRWRASIVPLAVVYSTPSLTAVVCQVTSKSSRKWLTFFGYDQYLNIPQHFLRQIPHWRGPSWGNPGILSVGRDVRSCQPTCIFSKFHAQGDKCLTWKQVLHPDTPWNSSFHPHVGHMLVMFVLTTLRSSISESHLQTKSLYICRPRQTQGGVRQGKEVVNTTFDWIKNMNTYKLWRRRRRQQC